MADHSRPDLCVIGAGALGIALAQHASRLGGRVVLVDRGVPEPGDGPQDALRLSALQHSAARAQSMRKSAPVGIANTEPKVSMKAVQERALDIASDQAVVTARDRLTAIGIEVIRGATSFADHHTVLVGDMRVRPRGMVLATGAVPVIPSVAGLDRIGYFTPDTLLENSRKLTHLLVIGGDESGLSLAQTFARFGSEVTLVPQGPILPGYDREIVAILIAALEEEGVRILDSAVVREILPRAQGTGVVVDLPSGDLEALDVSHVLVAAGRRADLVPLAPEKGGLRPLRGTEDQYALDERGRTSNRRIRATGAAAGIGQWHHALSQGRAVVESLLFGAPVQSPAQQPRLVMTDPPLAQIGGLSGQDGRLRAGQHVLRLSLAENDQARVLGAAWGLAKVSTLANGRIGGAGIVGPGAAEIAAVLALAMEKNVALAELSRLSLPHPSLLSSLAALADQADDLRPASPWSQRLRAIRRLLSL